ncbi:hypothetical protein ABL78_1854 [Leptomonas seymouri]|uniref:Uncharacterized protein n=1 Tax=Leptomonas seymouri TaxID=5684 RepID=A0A0N1PFP2_LEPSE|nr:hypothetical protein ABL78_1854 [Leptomonas seymouri]|eukprot:KPI89041.1 hypothetical protein ABL78_1854 [Leptomonas seymouri]
MDSINLGAFLRAQQSESEASDYTNSHDSTLLSPSSLHEVPLSAAGNQIDDISAHGKRSVRGKGYHTANGVNRLVETQKMRVQHPLDGHSDPTNDTLSLRSYWIALFTPQVYMAIFYAMRITFLVALPLGIIARHPAVQNTFPAHVVLPLWGIVDSRYAFGEQVAFNICTLQCSVLMMVWGVLNNAWNLHDHPTGWWCAVIFGAFCMSLLGDVRSRRMLVLTSVLVLQMESLPGGTELMFPVKVCRDVIMATAFAFFQCLFPIKSIAKDCDEVMAGGWKHIGRIARNSVTACWSNDPIECAIALGRLSTEPIQSLLNNLPEKLFFVTYEIWESTLRLELRRERVALLELCIPRLHTMTGAARAMVLKRTHRAQPKHSPSRHVDGHGARDGARMDVQIHEPYGVLGNANDCGDRLGMQQRQYREAEKDAFLKNMIRKDQADGGEGMLQSGLPEGNADMRVMRFQRLQWHRTSEILWEPVKNFLDALDAVLEGLGNHLNPHETAEKVPFAGLREAATDLQSKLDEVHFEALIKSETPVDPFLYNNIFAFHLSLIVLAERLLEYGGRMQNFDRRLYTSQLQRAWQFFFYDYWRDFWAELPKRVTLATPRDVRIFKDAIKMSCAYGVGAMFTAYIDPENVYYFGMAILMGVGWPTAGDTMEASVYRVTGMVCACSIAYVSIWHTPNLTAELAIALIAVFIALCFRDRPPYAHTAHYCSMLIVTALSSASNKLILLSRIVGNCFTVMSYYAIVVFIFPIDVLRVTYNAQVKAITLVVDRFSRLVDVIKQPFSPEDPAQYAMMREEVMSIRASRTPMWVALNSVGTWLPKAAADPAPLGNPYPLQAMRDMYSSLRRLGSATDIICTSLCTLLSDSTPRQRPDVEHILEAVAPVMQQVDEASRVLFQDFLDALSRPHEWSPSLTTYHFSRFLLLSHDLHHACWTAHRRNVKALRASFRTKVMNRTFEAAAKTNILDPLALERARSLSFVMQPSNTYLSMSLAQIGELEADGHAPHNMGASAAWSPSTNSSYGTGVTSAPSQDGDASDPVDVPTPGSTCVMQQSSILRNVSTATWAPPPATHGEDDTPAVTSGSILRTIAESMVLVRSAERFHSHMGLRGIPERRANGSWSTVPPPGSDTPLTDDSHSYSSEDVDSATEQYLRAKEQAEFEKALDPFERQAQEVERRAFIARRSLEYDQAEGCTLSHDVNMLLTILVGTDMFFAEAERLLKTMYAINEYTRSRVPPPKR